MSPTGDTATDGAPTSNNPNPNITINSLLRSSYPAQIAFSPQDFRRADESADPQFYVQPRFVQHIDDGAIEGLKGYYGDVIQEGARVLDLCSSWTSHLPEGLKGRLASCVGYGLNGKEMEANGHLTGFWVRDLNARVSQNGLGEEIPEKLLKEAADGTVDVVVCNVSVDYLIEPLKVLEEVKRCLKVGGTAHMAFSNRCFPTKVIGRWLKMRDEERRRWVGSYFWAVGGFEDVEEVILKDGRDWNDPLFVVRARKGWTAV
jgi:SAM-dependent methyltransferase